MIATYSRNSKSHPLKERSLARMSYGARSPKLELKLYLSPPRDLQRRQAAQLNGPASSPEVRSSCVSRETSPDGWSSPESGGGMMLVGCPRCLMYVMLLEADPKCPKCKSRVLLDFLHHEGINRQVKK